MSAPKRVLCVMDLVTLGRASLSVALPVLSACGAQCCPLPSSLFSTHTGGFSGVRREDLSAFGEAALSHLLAQEARMDAIYIGYLYSEGQYRLAQAAIRSFPGAFVAVDPALADNGKLYSGITTETVGWMRALCGEAHLITPNATESALLLGHDPADAEDPGRVASYLGQLAEGGRSVLITSAPDGAGGQQMLGSEGGESFALPVHKVGGGFPGTGDLFTSALLGRVLRGDGLQSAAVKAADFVASAVRRTTEGGGEVRQGVWFEGCLGELCHE